MSKETLNKARFQIWILRGRAEPDQTGETEGSGSDSQVIGSAGEVPCHRFSALHRLIPPAFPVFVGHALTVRPAITTLANPKSV